MAKIKKVKYRLSKIWSKLQMRYLLPGVLKQLPDVLTIELTNRCSLACSCCPNGTNRKYARTDSMLSVLKFRELLHQVDIPFKQVYLHLHGEPFLNSDIPQIVELLVSRGVQTFHIFSNAYNIDINLLEKTLEMIGKNKLNISFSAELYNKSIYEHYRCPGKFDTIWKSINDIDKLMVRFHQVYSINAIVNIDSIDNLDIYVPEIFKKLKNLSCIRFNSAFPWPYIPKTGDLAGHLKRRHSMCTQIWQLPVIMASGEVSMCSNDYRGDCVVGSLWNKKYSELLNCKAARHFRHHIVMRHSYRNKLCRNCLLERYIPFSCTVQRKFVENASETTLKKYFNSYYKYFAINEECV